MKTQSFKNSFIKKNNLVLWKNGKYNRSDIMKLTNYYEKAFRTTFSQAQKMAWAKAKAEKAKKQPQAAPKPKNNVVSLSEQRTSFNIDAVSMAIEYRIPLKKAKKMTLANWKK